MSWLYLIGAVLLEVAGTTSLKLAAGFANLGASVAAYAFYAASLALLALALKAIPIAVAYAIWSGLGTVAIVLIGAGWFKEPLGMVKLLFIAMIVVGCVGLQLSSGDAATRPE